MISGPFHIVAVAALVVERLGVGAVCAAAIDDAIDAHVNAEAGIDVDEAAGVESP